MTSRILTSETMTNFLDGVGTMTVTLDYYTVGWDDFYKGAGAIDCPVLLVSSEGQDWLAGWTDAQNTP